MIEKLVWLFFLIVWQDSWCWEKIYWFDGFFGLFSLGIIIVVDNSHIKRKYDSLRIQLNMIEINIHILFVIKLCLRTLPIFNLLIIF